MYTICKTISRKVQGDFSLNTGKEEHDQPEFQNQCSYMYMWMFTVADNVDVVVQL